MIHILDQNPNGIIFFEKLFVRYNFEEKSWIQVLPYIYFHNLLIPHDPHHGSKS